MPINKIVIIGNGLAAWTCASACARSLRGTPTTIHVVPPGLNLPGGDYSLGAPTVAEASSPALRRFHASYGYDESALINSTRGGYSLGVAMSDWSTGDVFNSFGEVGSVLGPVNFLQLGHRVRDLGHAFKFTNYSLAALMAQSGRFVPSGSVGHPAFAVLDHGLQIDVVAYSQAMKAEAIASGVTESASPFKQAKMTESGFVEGIVTDSNEFVEGELFVDCSGASRLLASQAHVAKLVDWSQWMVCNRIANSMVPDSGNAQPFMHLVARSDGWLRIVFLQGRCGESLCVHDGFAKDISANLYSFTAGHFDAPWQKNCVALGGASAVFDPSMSLSVSWLVSGIRRMIDLLPDSPQCAHEAIEFNRQSHDEIECARDYIVAHYKLNRRTEDPFWTTCRNMDVPDSLQHRIDVYRNCGRVVMRDGELVEHMNWATLFDAGNIIPTQYDVVTRGIPETLIQQHLNSVRETFIQAAKAAPTYQSWIKQAF